MRSPVTIAVLRTNRAPNFIVWSYQAPVTLQFSINRYVERLSASRTLSPRQTTSKKTLLREEEE